MPQLLRLGDTLETHRCSTHWTRRLTLLKPILRTLITKAVTACKFTTRLTFVTDWTLHGLYTDFFWW